jgi:hypothetical protein
VIGLTLYHCTQYQSALKLRVNPGVQRPVPIPCIAESTSHCQLAANLYKALAPSSVAIHLIDTMSRGAYISRSLSTNSSSSSTSSSASSRAATTIPNFTSIQQLFGNILRTPGVTVRKVERLCGRLHQIYLVKLTDGTSLVLKCPLNHNIRVLRHERTCLDTERKTLEIIHRYTQLPVPDVIQYDSQCGPFGSSFLIMSYVPGRTLSEIASWLTATERKSIDRVLGAYVRTLTTLSSTQFGTIRCVSAKKGNASWRKVFLGFLEAALRDAEDILDMSRYRA